MGYVESNLLSDEKVVFKTKLHWMLFFWPVFFVFFGIFMVGVSGETNSAGSTWGVLFFLYGCVKGFLALINLFTAEFAVTDKRIVIKEGVLKKVTVEMNRDKIDNVTADQGIMGRMLGYGTIIISGTEGTKKVFKKVVRPLDFKDKTLQALV